MAAAAQGHVVPGDAGGGQGPCDGERAEHDAGGEAGGLWFTRGDDVRRGGSDGQGGDAGQQEGTDATGAGLHGFSSARCDHNPFAKQFYRSDRNGVATVQRGDLIDDVRSLLARAGFAVSERCDLRPVSFDLVARRDRDLLILKVLTNVDALTEAIAAEIKLLCRFLEGRPLLVGLRAGAGNLEDGVIYNRHDIPIVTPTTMAEYVLDGTPPMVFAAPGGFYVHLDHDALRQARTDLGVSLGTVAQIAGVSRRAIQMYEQGMSASIDAAMRLEEFLQRELIRPTDPLALSLIHI